MVPWSVGSVNRTLASLMPTSRLPAFSMRHDPGLQILFEEQDSMSLAHMRNVLAEVHRPLAEAEKPGRFLDREQGHLR